MNNKATKQTFRDLNRHLTLFVPINGDKPAGPYVWPSEDELGRRVPLSRAAFFQQLAPAIRCHEQPIEIGDEVFTGIAYETTPGAEGGVSQRLQPNGLELADVENDGDLLEVQTWQRMGGKLLRDLVRSLDITLQFSHPKFTAALLRLVRRYMIDHANTALLDEGSAEQIAIHAWRGLLSHHRLNASLLKYVTCPVDDEEATEAEMEAILAEIGAEKFGPLNPARNVHLMSGLRTIKLVLTSGAADDPLYAELARQKQYSFLENYPASPEYGRRIIGAEGAPAAKDRSLMGHYRAFREHSDSIHRYIRSGASQAAAMMWWASRYEEFESLDGSVLAEVGTAIYERGISAQGTNRIPGQTAEERAEIERIVADARSQISEEERGQLERLNTYPISCNQVSDFLQFALIAERSFGLGELTERARSLFTALAMLSGGSLNEVHAQAQARSEQLAGVYRTVKNARASQESEGGGQAELLLEDIRVALLAHGARCPETLEFSQKLAKGCEELETLHGEELRAAVSRLAVEQMAVEVKTNHDESLLDDQDALRKEEALYQQLFDFNHKCNTLPQTQDTVGLTPACTYTAHVVELQTHGALDERTQRRYQQSVDLVSKQAEATHPPKVALEENESACFEPGVVSGLSDASGQRVAEVELSPSGGELLVRATEGLKPNTKLEDVVWAHDQGEVSERVQEQVRRQLARGCEREASRQQALEGYATYSEILGRIIEFYSDEKQQQGDKSLSTRAARAQLFSSYLLSTPAHLSRLGKRDLSSGNGLTIDIVEHWGKLEDDEVYLGRRPLRPTELERINVSRHFPVSDENGPDEVVGIVQYWATQCEQLARLRPQLDDIAGIAEVFSALEGSDAKVTLYNCTLAEHANREKGQRGSTPRTEDLFFVSNPSALAYVGAAQASLGALEDRLLTALGLSDEALGSAQLPVIVSSNPALSRRTSAFPIVGTTQLSLSPLHKDGVGGAGVPCSPAASCRINPFLGLAASLLVNEEDDSLGRFGRLTEVERLETLSRTKVEPWPGQTLGGYYRRAWSVPGSQACTLIEMTRAFNSCLNHLRSGGRGTVLQSLESIVAVLLQRGLEAEVSLGATGDPWQEAHVGVLPHGVATPTLYKDDPTTLLTSFTASVGLADPGIGLKLNGHAWLVQDMAGFLVRLREGLRSARLEAA